MHPWQVCISPGVALRSTVTMREQTTEVGIGLRKGHTHLHIIMLSNAMGLTSCRDAGAYHATSDGIVTWLFKYFPVNVAHKRSPSNT